MDYTLISLNPKSRELNASLTILRLREQESARASDEEILREQESKRERERDRERSCYSRGENWLTSRKQENHFVNDWRI